MILSASSVWLRANPQEYVAARRAAADGLVDSIQEAVTQNRQREPIGGREIIRVLRIHAPAVRPGRAQREVVAYGQAQDANRRRGRRRGHSNYPGAKKMDGADIAVVRSDVGNGGGDGVLYKIVVHHSRTED